MPLGASLPLTTDQTIACSLADSHDAFAVPSVRPKAIVIVSNAYQVSGSMKKMGNSLKYSIFGPLPP
jgi:hypothetical protein